MVSRSPQSPVLTSLRAGCPASWHPTEQVTETRGLCGVHCLQTGFSLSETGRHRDNKCIKSTHCVPETYMFYINYKSKTLGRKRVIDTHVLLIYYTGLRVSARLKIRKGEVSPRNHLKPPFDVIFYAYGIYPTPPHPTHCPLPASSPLD